MNKLIENADKSRTKRIIMAFPHRNMPRTEILDFIRDLKKSEILDVIDYFNEIIPADEVDIEFNRSGTRNDLVEQLEPYKKVTRDLLIEALEEVLDPDDFEEYENDDTDYEDSDDESGYSNEEYKRHLLDEFHREPGPEDKREYQGVALRKIRESIEYTDKKARAILHVATGGGKTKIANDAVQEFLVANKSAKVLWVSNKGWRLLYQASADMNRRYKNNKWMNRLGGHSREISFLPENKQDARLTYTTINTLYNRYWSLKKYDLIVFDEIHHGQGVTMLNTLLDQFVKQTNILGLTATPKPSSKFKVVFRKEFFELVKEGYLARPHVKQIETGIDWFPKLKNQWMIDNQSYRDLSQNRKRNELIVDHYCQNRNEYGKTLIFAYDINHCKALAEIFSSKPVTCGVLYHSMSHQQRHKVIKEFENNQIEVLINVEMMTTGVDIPSIKTIFLARPTESQILFSQMVGRGARLDSGKKEFFVRDFTDNIKTHKDLLVSSKKFFEGSTASSGNPQNREYTQHDETRYPFLDYDPNHGFVHFQMKDWNENELLVPLNRGQSFGVEIELTSDDYEDYLENRKDWDRRAKTLLNVVISAVGAERVHPHPFWEGGGDYTKYSIVKDGSCGWEIVAPILKREKGFTELEKLLNTLDSSTVLKTMGLKVNHRTGLHVHLGFNFPSVKELKRLLHSTRLLEPYLALLVSPSRVCEYIGADEYDSTSPNPYCVSWSQTVDSKWIENLNGIDDFEKKLEKIVLPTEIKDDPRYMTLNFTNLLYKEKKDQTIEIRMMNGILDSKRVLPWISLWMQLLQACRSKEVDVSKVPSLKYHPLPTTAHYKELSGVFNYYLSNPSPNFMNHILNWTHKLKERWNLITHIEYKEATTGDFIEFKKLNDEEKERVTRQLMKSNGLTGTVEEQIKRFKKDHLMVIYHKESGSLIAASGYKFSINEKIIASISTTSIKESAVSEKKLKTFLSNIENHNVIEKSWEYRNSLCSKKQFREHFKGQMKFLRSLKHQDCSIFASVQESNIQAQNFFRKAGFEPFLKIKSPWTENNLVIFVNTSTEQF